MDFLQRTSLIYITFFVIQCSLISADIPRPRGVPIQRALLYYPNVDNNKWTCLDGSKTIGFEQINDDYCDCPIDGSDEPGTSACPSATFHCENVGHRSLNVGSSRVNDGICDCCDGSDEYISGHCQNACQEMGLAEMELQKSRAELHKRGAAKRSEMISKGRQMRVEREARRVELEQRRLEQQAIKEEKQNLQRIAEAAESEALETYRVLQNEKEGAEAAARANAEEEPQAQRVEAETHFLRYDTNKDGLVEVSELQVDITLDRDRNGVVTVEEAKYFLDERDRIDLDTFIALSWPRIKPLKMLAEGIFKPPKALEEELDEDVQGEDKTSHLEGSEGVKSEDVNEEEHEEHDDSENDEEEHEEFEDEQDVGVGSATPEEKPSVEYDPETQRLIDLANEARKATSDVENELRQIEHEMKEIDDFNNKDYGPNDEYAAMEGECYTFEDREYVYTLCPFERASQRSRSGGSETTLGRWDQWIGEGDNKYSKQKYSHGSSCWNGPQRSAIVSMSCGLETQIIGVSEPNRCEYFYEFETPAACDDLSDSNKDDHDQTHDEL